MSRDSVSRSEDLEDQAPIVRAQLKWFNSTKGFGFLVPIDEPVDAFVHITTLQQSGYAILGEGAIVDCSISSGPKGHQVTKIHKVIDKGKDAASTDVDSGKMALHEMKGYVKWYKPDKGFGFIVPEDGKKDIFVHKSCLDREGIGRLETGDKVIVSVQLVDKGREAIKIVIDGE